MSEPTASRGGLLRQLVLRGSVVSLAVRVAGVLLGYAAHILLSRTLGLADYGLYVIALGWALVLGIPARLGFDYSALRYATIYLHDRNWSALRGFFQAALLSMTLASLVLAGIVLLIGRLAGLAGYTLLLGIGAVIVTTALIGFLSVMMRSAQRIFSSQFYDQALRPAVMILLLIVISRGASGHLGAPGAMLVTAAAAVLALIAVGIEFGRVFREAWLAAPDFTNHRAWLRVSLPLLMITGVQEIMNQLQVIMLGWLADAASAGLYAAAWRLASLIGFGLAALGTVSGPMIASAFHRGEMEEVNRIAGFTARVAVGFALPAAAVLFLWGRDLLGLFGLEFVAAYPVLLILVAGALLNSATGIVAYLLTLTGRERQALKIFLAALGVDLVLNFLLIPGQRAFGAAIGCAVTVAVWNLAMLVAVRRGLGVDASLIGRPYRAR